MHLNRIWRLFDLNYHALSQNKGQKNSVLPCFEQKKVEKWPKHEKNTKRQPEPWKSPHESPLDSPISAKSVGIGEI